MAVPKEKVVGEEEVVELLQAVGHRVATARARGAAYQATHGWIHPQCARPSPRMKTRAENKMQMIHAAGADFWPADTPFRSKKEHTLTLARASVDGGLMLHGATRSARAAAKHDMRFGRGLHWLELIALCIRNSYYR